MSENKKEGTVHTCNFCGATNVDGKTDCLVMSEDGTVICDTCVSHCEAIVAERKRDDIDFRRIPGSRYKVTKEKLRPITSIPKRWVVCDTHLFRGVPTITACSPNGKKREIFSIPKPLAHWMISKDEKLDVDNIRETIKLELSSTVRAAIGSYCLGEDCDV